MREKNEIDERKDYWTAEAKHPQAMRRCYIYLTRKNNWPKKKRKEYETAGGNSYVSSGLEAMTYNDWTYHPIVRPENPDCPEEDDLYCKRLIQLVNHAAVSGYFNEHPEKKRNYMAWRKIE